MRRLIKSYRIKVAMDERVEKFLNYLNQNKEEIATDIVLDSPEYSNTDSFEDSLFDKMTSYKIDEATDTFIKKLNEFIKNHEAVNGILHDTHGDELYDVIYQSEAFKDVYNSVCDEFNDKVNKEIEEGYGLACKKIFENFAKTGDGVFGYVSGLQDEFGVDDFFQEHLEDGDEEFDEAEETIEKVCKSIEKFSDMDAMSFAEMMVKNSDEANEYLKKLQKDFGLDNEQMRLDFLDEFVSQFH